MVFCRTCNSLSVVWRLQPFSCDTMVPGMKAFILLAALAGLSGCTATSSSTTTSSAVQRPSSAEAECARFGYVAGTQPFQACVADLRQQAKVLAAARP